MSALKERIDIEEQKEREKMAARIKMQQESELQNRQIPPRQPDVRQEWKGTREAALAFIASRERKHATETIVQRILFENHIYTTRDDDRPEMWIYEEGIYKPQGKTYIQEAVREILGEAFTSQICNDVIRKIEADTYIDQDEFFDKQNNFPNILPVENGLLDIKNRELHPFTPQLFFFNKLPVTYDQRKDCPNVKKFFQEVLASEEDIRVLQEFFGFSMLKEYKFEKSLMLTGTGRNGKGKTLDLLKRFLGLENCANISLEDIEKDQFALSELHNKLVNISGDISNAAIKNSGNFKSLTGRDLIQAARKFKTRVQFVNYAKMVFAANELPYTYDMSNAFFDRWIMLEFPFRFLPQKEIDALDNTEHVKLQDPAIIQKLTTSEEMSGLLNWALEGFRRLEEQKDFSYSPTSQKVREEWTRRMSSFQAFCMDCVVEDWSGEVSKAELRREYSAYCRKNKVRGESDKRIKRVLEEQFGASDERSSSGDRQMVWVGIKLKSVKDVKDVKGVQVPIEIKNPIENVNTLDKLDTLDNDTSESPKEARIARIDDFILNTVRAMCKRSGDLAKVTEVEEYCLKWGIGDFGERYSRLLQIGELIEPKPGMVKRL